MMNSQELETAVRLKLNLVVLILNDSSYGMIRWKQAGMGFKDWGLEYSNPDFSLYARSYGVTPHEIQEHSSLPIVIDEAFDSGGVHLIDLPVDYSENVKNLISDLAEHEPVI